MKVTLDHIYQQNHDAFSYYFKSPKPLGYTAGQFIEMYLPHDAPDERGQKHWFTLSSSPTEELLAITTRFAARSSTFKQCLRGLKVGESVEMSEAMGDFVLPKDTSIPLVFVAAGIGVTPYRSMVKWLADSSEKCTIQVLLAVTTPEDVVFKDLFENYGLTPMVIPSHPPVDWQGESGRLTAERIAQLIGGIDNKRIYVSGPEQMVEVFEKDFKAMGLDETQWVGDFFPGYSEI